jgi:hypothetical protein
MGDRVSKSSSLSDPKVIELLNRDFNAIELNVTDLGFPAWITALAPWKAIYDSSPEARAAFTNMAVVDADGVFLLGSGDTGKIGRTAAEFSMNYQPDKYLKMLETTLARSARLEAVRTDAALSDEARTAAIAAIRLEVDQGLAQVFKTEPYFLQKVQALRR